MEPREFTNSKITVPDDIWNAVASVVPRLSRVEAVIRINRLLGPNARGIGISWYKKELARRKREAAENALTLPLAADDAAGCAPKRKACANCSCGCVRGRGRARVAPAHARQNKN